MASEYSTSADTATVEQAAVHEQQGIQPMRWRELVALGLWTLLADWLIFRTWGYAGPALFVTLVPFFFLAREFCSPAKWMTVTIVALLWLCAARLSWSGSGLTVAAAVVMVFALAMVASGCLPLVLEASTFAARVLIDGLIWIFGHRLPGAPAVGLGGSSRATYLLPLVATVVFGGIFVLANPDLLDLVSSRITHVADRLWIWIAGISYWEAPFCLTAFVLGAGLLRPLAPMSLIGPTDTRYVIDQQDVHPAPLFAAYRNTLVVLILLFTVYLVFELTTLWKRDFPPGFYYAGYAHQGAAWLTFALTLATALLSLIFSGTMLRDPRLQVVRALAWAWSAQNLLLAAAVYNRLMIYVGYNGMTRLRIVAFFGTTVVVIGFVLVLVKIIKDRSFWWLIRAQLFALALTVIAYSLCPVDYLTHRYNVAQVAGGYLHPAVMIAVKPIDDEGLFPVLGLIGVDDRIIREGVLAMLAQRQLEIEETAEDDWHWTKFQAATHLLYQQLALHKTRWKKYLDGTANRKAAIESFQNYAMQWY